MPPHHHAPSQLLPLLRKGQLRDAPRRVRFEKQGWAGCRSQGNTGKEKRLEWAPNQSPVPEASAEAGAE